MEENMTAAAPVSSGKGSFKPRLITSICYVIVWAGLTALKWTVPGGWGSLGFDVLFCAVSVIGSVEYLRATGGVSFPQKAFTIAFGAIVVPLYVGVELSMQKGFLAIACAFTVYVMFLMAASVFDPQRSTVKGTVSCIFCMLYCGVLSAILSSVNHLGRNSMAAVLMLFMVPVFTDTGAFIFGSLFKKFIPLKLSPKLSPNKTVIGAVGGIVGGILSGLVSYALIYYFGGVNDNIVLTRFNDIYLVFSSNAIHPIVTFILVGLATSVLAQVGDLFESAIKRECNIKDMGKLLPGHGGVLDRFDSMLYCSVVVLLSFGTIII